MNKLTTKQHSRRLTVTGDCKPQKDIIIIYYASSTQCSG